MNCKAFTLVEILIVVVILGILAAIVIPTFSEQSSGATGQETAKVSTYTDREVYIDLQTLETTEKDEQKEYVDTLRLEIKEVKNGWIELSGSEPKEFADRVETAKALLVLKDIITQEECNELVPHNRELIGNKTVIRYKKSTPNDS